MPRKPASTPAPVRARKTGGAPDAARGVADAKRDSHDARRGAHDAELGQRLKYVRELFGYSQRELGQRAGLTHGTISFIERGKISPSVGTLRKILDSFPMTLSEFFAIDPNAEPKVFFEHDELLEVGGGGVSLKQVGRNLKGRPLQILFERYPPGAETAGEPYSHDGEEGGMVVQGRIELTVGNQTRVLGPGEGYLFPSRVPHRFRNPGPDECVIVSANSPPV